MRDRGETVPLLVGVDHQRHVGAQVFTDAADPLKVDPCVG